MTIVSSDMSGHSSATVTIADDMVDGTLTWHHRLDLSR
jgi:hypothetical protein